MHVIINNVWKVENADSFGEVDLRNIRANREVHYDQEISSLDKKSNI